MPRNCRLGGPRCPPRVSPPHTHCRPCAPSSTALPPPPHTHPPTPTPPPPPPTHTHTHTTTTTTTTRGGAAAQPGPAVHRRREHRPAQHLLRKVLDALPGVWVGRGAGGGWGGWGARRALLGRTTPHLAHSPTDCLGSNSVRPVCSATHPEREQIGEILSHLWALPPHRAAWRQLAQQQQRQHVQVGGVMGGGLSHGDRCWRRAEETADSTT